MKVFIQIYTFYICFDLLHIVVINSSINFGMHSIWWHQQDQFRKIVVVFLQENNKNIGIRKEKQTRDDWIFFFHRSPADACFLSRILQNAARRNSYLKGFFLFKTRPSPCLGYWPTFMNYYQLGDINRLVPLHILLEHNNNQSATDLLVQILNTFLLVLLLLLAILSHNILTCLMIINFN